VGKSSLLLRFSKNVFEENFTPTLGVDFHIKTFKLKGKVIKLQI
jgi:GTPase SAR1 family protein